MLTAIVVHFFLLKSYLQHNTMLPLSTSPSCCVQSFTVGLGLNSAMTPSPFHPSSYCVWSSTIGLGLNPTTTPSRFHPSSYCVRSFVPYALVLDVYACIVDPRMFLGCRHRSLGSRRETSGYPPSGAGSSPHGSCLACGRRVSTSTC